MKQQGKQEKEVEEEAEEEEEVEVEELNVSYFNNQSILVTHTHLHTLT